MSDARHALALRIPAVLGRLRSTVSALADGEPRLEAAVGFLDSLIPTYPDGPGVPENGPIDLLRRKYDLTDRQLEMVILAGLPDEHEGLAHLCRMLHPRSEPRVTLGLAMQVLARDFASRSEHAADLLTGRLTRAGIVRVGTEDPVFDRNLEPASQLWPALNGSDLWPEWIDVLEGPVTTSGLREWLNQPLPTRVAELLREETPRVVVVTAERTDVAMQRAAAIARHGAIDAVLLTSTVPATSDHLQVLTLHAAIRDLVPIVGVTPSDHPLELIDPPVMAGPMAVCAVHGSITVRTRRPVVTLRAGALRPADRRLMWSEVLPELADRAPELASRHPIEPAAAAVVATDVRDLVDGRQPTVTDVSAAISARGVAVPGGGVASITPRATWDDLVLPPRQEGLLRGAVARLRHQAIVLDEWGFLTSRRGARGVRMLFAGPPGTGKTLSAEVLASAIGGLDLLIVDISKIVSKWIGETEKNLSRVFDLAENSVLFFDEADALFGRRTEVSDAHDRYANLETAYLLARLEQFEGLAILATNLKANIDPAFLRRMEYVVDFREPARDEREAMWRRHVPATAPVASDVDFAALADRFPVVGGLIRNAAVGAAFIAAEVDTPICQADFVTAMQTEYEKAGLAYPMSYVPATG